MRGNRYLLFSLFFIFFLFQISFNLVDGLTITGRAVMQQATVNITIVSNAPSLNISRPLNSSYFTNQSIPFAYSVSGALNVWFNIDNGQNTSLPSSSYQGNFSTSLGSHTLFIFANNSDSMLTKKNVSFFVNLTGHYINYSEFQGTYSGNSTNFDIYSSDELQNLTGIKFQDTRAGQIFFPGVINVTNVGESNVNIAQFVNISFNRIELNSTGLQNFNASATLSIYDLSFSNPSILRDGSECPSSICTEQSYSDGNFIFNVSGFSTYSAEESSSDDSGDSGSSGSSGSSGGGGGGGGGSGASAKPAPKIVVDPETISIGLKQGETKKGEFSIRNSDTQDRTITLSALKIEDIIKFEEENFVLKAGETKDIEFDVIAREDALTETRIGKIIVSSVGEKHEILVATSINPNGALFDLKVEILKKYETVLPGEEIIATLDVFNLGQLGAVDVIIVHELIDENGNSFSRQEQSVAVETQASFIVTHKVPLGLEYGRYALVVSVDYDGGKQASTSHWVNIGEGDSFFDNISISVSLIITVVLILVIAIIFIIIIFEDRKMLENLKKSSRYKR